MAPNGWNEWSKHVLAELERLNVCYEQLNEKFDKKIGEVYDRINQLHTEVAMLKVKSGIWGLLAGAIPVAIALIIYYLRQG